MRGAGQEAAPREKLTFRPFADPTGIPRPTQAKSARVPVSIPWVGECISPDFHVKATLRTTA